MGLGHSDRGVPHAIRAPIGARVLSRAAAGACALALCLPMSALAASLQVKFSYWFVVAGNRGHRVRPGGTFVHCASVKAVSIQAYGHVTGKGVASVVWRLAGRQIDPHKYRLFSAPWSWPFVDYSGLSDGKYAIEIVQGGVPVGHASLRLASNQLC